MNTGKKISMHGISASNSDLDCQMEASQEAYSVPDKVEIWTSGASSYPEVEDGYYYFGLRQPDEGTDTLIEDWVVCNNIGSIKATTDILADAIVAGVCRKMEEGKKREPVLESELKKIYQEVIWH